MNNETQPIYILNTSEIQPSTTSQKLVEISTHANLENVEDFSNVCRTCATIAEFVIPLFDGEGLQSNLAEKIHKHLPIQVSPEDILPRVVCYQCASTLLAWHELVQCCVEADSALRTRLAVNNPSNQEQKIKIIEDGQNPETSDESKFGKITEFVGQPMEPPQYVDNSTSTTTGPITTCDYCKIDYAEVVYRDHLVATHSELLFYCDECDTYVDRKDFILHMSLHAVQYATNQCKKVEPKEEKENKVKKKKKKDNKHNESTEVKERDRSEKSDEQDEISNDDNDNVNEFSDHSDMEYFEALPKSVFEAIEDSQDNPPDDDADAPVHSQDDRPSSSSALNSTHTSTNSETTVNQKKIRTCPICSKTYTAASSYFYHMKYSHIENKEFECDVCGNKFGSKASLTQHATVHSGEFQYECTECGKRFRSKASLYIHEQTHNGIKVWACAQCNMSFRWRTHLLRHTKRHTAVKGHICTTCGRGFTIKCDLLRHMRTHSAGEFACEKCGQKFAQSRYLKVHMDKKHTTIEDSPKA